MLPASNRAAGMNIGFPDVCLTPAGPAVVPVPYPNIAMNAMATPFSPNVLLTMVPALNMGSVIPMTSGDEPGTASPIKGPSTYTMGNPKVFINALPAITLTCPTKGNSMNNPVGAVLVPSVTNVFFTWSEAPVEPSREGLAALREALSEDGRNVAGAMIGEGVGYVGIGVFSRDVPARVFSAIRDLSGQGMRALVIDLRGNPGGELSACVDLAGDFLEPGSEIVTVRDQDGDDTVYRARQEEPYRFPVMILVNRDTASAAEIFAGALRAHGRAVVAGEATHGKGIGHALVPSPGGALLPVFAAITLPGGIALHGVGVQPDVPLPAR